MAKGDHLSVSHQLYTHHGIDMGDGHVVHYGRGLSDIQNAEIEIVTLEVFSDDQSVSIVHSAVEFSRAEIVERALSRLGEKCYDVFDNNCEHFANWCRSGNEVSAQSATTKTILRQSAAIASKPLARKLVRSVAIRKSLTAPLIIADVIQAGIEIVAIKNGKSGEESERLGQRAGAATSVGIGLVSGGPIGAASGFGIWMAGQILGRAALSAGKDAVKKRATDSDS